MLWTREADRAAFIDYIIVAACLPLMIYECGVATAKIKP